MVEHALLYIAQSGKVLTARQLHAQANRAVGREVSVAYVYRLLHRHDWRKLGPRPVRLTVKSPA
ncbi:MAG: winged helix-turn-helix domain-containing protein [Phycisphaerae bacterium]